jgi:hypothetical protein
MLGERSSDNGSDGVDSDKINKPVREAQSRTSLYLGCYSSMVSCGKAFRWLLRMRPQAGTNSTMTPEQHGPLRRFFRDLGPGLITGAADDDPSGISTYSVAGAAYGYTGLWTALFSFPLMAAVQLMCARLGMVTGRGLAGVIRVRYPPPILWFACTLLIRRMCLILEPTSGAWGTRCRW